MARFYMTIATTLSNEEMAQDRDLRAREDVCALSAPTVPAMSHTIRSNNKKFLIANLELEFELNRRKQSTLRISNRKYFAIFSSASARVSAATAAQPKNSNRNIRILEFRITPSLSLLTHFLTATKSTFSPFAPPRFSPRKGISRDMIPALPPLP